MARSSVISGGARSQGSQLTGKIVTMVSKLKARSTTQFRFEILKYHACNTNYYQAVQILAEIQEMTSSSSTAAELLRERAVLAGSTLWTREPSRRTMPDFVRHMSTLHAEMKTIAGPAIADFDPHYHWKDYDGAVAGNAEDDTEMDDEAAMGAKTRHEANTIAHDSSFLARSEKVTGNAVGTGAAYVSDFGNQETEGGERIKQEVGSTSQRRFESAASGEEGSQDFDDEAVLLDVLEGNNVSEEDQRLLIRSIVCGLDSNKKVDRIKLFLVELEAAVCSEEARLDQEAKLKRERQEKEERRA